MWGSLFFSHLYRWMKSFNNTLTTPLAYIYVSLLFTFINASWFYGSLHHDTFRLNVLAILSDKNARALKCGFKVGHG